MALFVSTFNSDISNVISSSGQRESTLFECFNSLEPDQSLISLPCGWLHVPYNPLLKEGHKYSETRLKQPLKNRQNNDLSDKW